MNKVLIMLVLIVIMATPSFADVNMSIGVSTYGGDATIYANPNTGTGETRYFLDGKDFDQSIYNLQEDIGDSLKMDSVYRNLYDLFMYRDSFKHEWHYTQSEDIKYINGQILKWVLETVFVPREELFSIIERQNNRIQQLEFEIMTLQKLFDDEEICMARISVAAENNMSKVGCGDKIYYHNPEVDSGFVGLKEVK